MVEDRQQHDRDAGLRRAVRFSSDAWQVAGSIAWWRLVTLIRCFVLAVPLLSSRPPAPLKRCSNRRLPPQTSPDPSRIRWSARRWATRKCWRRPPRSPGSPRSTSASSPRSCLSRRILLGGIIVSAALFVLGIIVISEQGTLSLMNNASLASIGFSKTFGFGSDQFFLSEPLLKVSLLLGVIAAGYFVFANPDLDDNADLVVPKFIRKMVALRACYGSCPKMTRGRRRRSPNPLPTARVLPPPRALSPCHRRRGPPSRLRRLPGRQRSPRPAADSPVQTAAPPAPSRRLVLPVGSVPPRRRRGSLLPQS